MSEIDSTEDESDEKALLEERLKAIEADLRQKKEIILAQHTKLEAFFDSSIDAVVQMDFDGHITGWNHQAEKIFGWKRRRNTRSDNRTNYNPGALSGSP